MTKEKLSALNKLFVATYGTLLNNSLESKEERKKRLAEEKLEKYMMELLDDEEDLNVR